MPNLDMTKTIELLGQLSKQLEGFQTATTADGVVRTMNDAKMGDLVRFYFDKPMDSSREGTDIRTAVAYKTSYYTDATVIGYYDDGDPLLGWKLPPPTRRVEIHDIGQPSTKIAHFNDYTHGQYTKQNTLCELRSVYSHVSPSKEEPKKEKFVGVRSLKIGDVVKFYTRRSDWNYTDLADANGVVTDYPTEATVIGFGKHAGGPENCPVLGWKAKIPRLYELTGVTRPLHTIADYDTYKSACWLITNVPCVLVDHTDVAATKIEEFKRAFEAEVGEVIRLYFDKAPDPLDDDAILGVSHKTVHNIDAEVIQKTGASAYIGWKRKAPKWALPIKECEDVSDLSKQGYTHAAYLDPDCAFIPSTISKAKLNSSKAGPIKPEKKAVVKVKPEVKQEAKPGCPIIKVGDRIRLHEWNRQPANFDATVLRFHVYDDGTVVGDIGWRQGEEPSSTETTSRSYGQTWWKAILPEFISSRVLSSREDKWTVLPPITTELPKVEAAEQHASTETEKFVPTSNVAVGSKVRFYFPNPPTSAMWAVDMASKTKTEHFIDTTIIGFTHENRAMIGWKDGAPSWVGYKVASCGVPARSVQNLGAYTDGFYMGPSAKCVVLSGPEPAKAEVKPEPPKVEPTSKASTKCLSYKQFKLGDLIRVYFDETPSDTVAFAQHSVDHETNIFIDVRVIGTDGHGCAVIGRKDHQAWMGSGLKRTCSYLKIPSIQASDYEDYEYAWWISSTMKGFVIDTKPTVSVAAVKVIEEPKETNKTEPTETTMALQEISNAKLGDRIKFYMDSYRNYSNKPTAYTMEATVIESGNLYKYARLGWKKDEQLPAFVTNNSGKDVEYTTAVDNLADYVHRHSVGDTLMCEILPPLQKKDQATGKEMDLGGALMAVAAVAGAAIACFAGASSKQRDVVRVAEGLDTAEVSDYSGPEELPIEASQ